MHSITAPAKGATDSSFLVIFCLFRNTQVCARTQILQAAVCPAQPSPQLFGVLLWLSETLSTAPVRQPCPSAVSAWHLFSPNNSNSHIPALFAGILTRALWHRWRWNATAQESTWLPFAALPSLSRCLPGGWHEAASNSTIFHLRSRSILINSGV